MLLFIPLTEHVGTFNGLKTVHTFLFIRIPVLILCSIIVLSLVVSMGQHTAEEFVIITIVMIALEITGIVPIHWFKNSNFFKSHFYLAFALLLMLFNLLAITFGHGRGKLTISGTYEYYLSALIWQIAVIQSYRNRHLWRNLMNHIFMWNHLSNYKLDAIKILKCPILYIVMFVFLVHIAYILSQSIKYSDINGIWSLVRSLICLRAVFLVYFFKSRYNYLTMKLRKIPQESLETAMEMILTIRKSYLELSDLVHKFNDMTGHQTLIVIAFSSLQLINMAVFFISFSRMEAKEEVITHKLRYMFPYVVTVFNLFYMMDCCNAVGQASEELLRVSYEVDAQFSIFQEHFLELKSLSKLMYAHRIKITAADYFEINRLTIFYFMYNTSTYFVVLAQFYSVNKN